MNSTPAFMFVQTCKYARRLVSRLTISNSPKIPGSGRRTKQRHAIKILFIGCITIIALTPPPSIQAKSVYKWVDESGKTFYSQTPPSKGRVERITTKTTDSKDSAEAAKKRLQDQLRKIDQQKQGPALTKQKKREHTLSAKDLEKKCKGVKSNISLLSNNARRVSQKMEDGSRSVLPQEDREKQLKILKEFYNKHCTK